MRLERIEAFPLKYPEPHDSGRDRYITLVRIESNEGMVGWGECIAQWPESALAVKVVIERGLSTVVLGENASDVVRLWQKMRDHSHWYGNGGIASFAISAIDMALWDLKGQALGVPVYELLGGLRTARMRACASVIFDTVNQEATASDFASYRSRGYTAVKGGWGKSPTTAFGLNPTRDLSLVRKIREAIGDDVDFVVDVGTHVRWTPSHAIRMAREFEEFRLFWLEEPLPQDDLDGYRRLHAAVSTPIATGEKEWTLGAFKSLIHSGGVDIVMPDAGKAEGITGFKRIIDYADANHIRFTPHSWSSAINTAAAAHLFASSANGVVFELKPERSPMQQDLVDEPIEQHDGFVEPPHVPGLGIHVDETTVRRYVFD